MFKVMLVATFANLAMGNVLVATGCLIAAALHGYADYKFGTDKF